LHKEVVVQQLKVTIEIDGQVVQQLIEAVDGTLEQREETIDAMSRRLAAAALQASVDSVAAPRPLFRRRAARCDTKATSRER